MTYALLDLRRSRRRAMERGFNCSRSTNGGWIVKAPSVPDLEIGAFTTTDDLVSFLNAELLYEQPIAPDRSPEEGQ